MYVKEREQKEKKEGEKKKRNLSYIGDLSQTPLLSVREEVMHNQTSLSEVVGIRTKLFAIVAGMFTFLYSASSPPTSFSGD